MLSSLQVPYFSFIVLLYACFYSNSLTPAFEFYPIDQSASFNFLLVYCYGLVMLFSLSMMLFMPGYPQIP